MHLGMPVVALATTEAHEAVPPGTGFCSTDVDGLARALRELVREPDRARELGATARAHVLARYGLERFLTGWDAVLDRAMHMHDRRAGRQPAAAGHRE
jgi:glycosyltransferase involved in cell wall biosynthesis